MGSARVNLEFKFQSVMVRVGNSVERFDQYVPKNHRKFQRQLIDNMSRSQETLTWVVDALVRGEKIRRPLIKPNGFLLTVMLTIHI